MVLVGFPLDISVRTHICIGWLRVFGAIVKIPEGLPTDQDFQDHQEPEELELPEQHLVGTA